MGTRKVLDLAADGAGFRSLVLHLPALWPLPTLTLCFVFCGTGGSGDGDVSGDGLSAVSWQALLLREQQGLGEKPGPSTELWDLGQAPSLRPPYFTCKMGR